MYITLIGYQPTNALFVKEYKKSKDEKYQGH